MGRSQQWKVFLKPEESKEIRAIERALASKKAELSRLSKRRELIRNRVCMRKRYAEQALLGPD
jgi:hypothetical protein